MNISEVASIIGAAAGTVSLAGIVYIVGYWKGTVDTRLGKLCQVDERYPPQETYRMAKTMWDIYVVGALQNRPDLAEHASPYKLKKNAMEMIPQDLKEELDSMPLANSHIEDVATGWLVVQKLGLERISRFAEDKKLSVQEAIAILSTHLDCRLRRVYVIPPGRSR